MEISQRVYKNEVINLNFLDHTIEATKTINDWVKVRTRGKIADILDQPVDFNTKLIIASALYFSGEWDRYFSPGDTRRRPFLVTPNESVLVDMMYNGGKFPFYEDEGLGVKMIGLPYKGYEPGPSSEFLSSSKFQATMYIMLPTFKDADALSRLESRLNPNNIEDMIGKMVNRTCVVVFPRMKLSSSLNLNEALKELGLSSLFDARTSNLGLLSPGYNEAAEIFTRFGGDEDDNTTPGNGEPRVANNKSDKDNHFRYEDKRGGYTVDQWNSGVLIQKIPNSYPQKRSINGSIQTSKRMMDERNTYETPFANSSLVEKLKVIAIGKDKYQFESSIRSKRQQARPIDDAFVRFIESRRVLPNYGLDALRNSPNLTNPGLFASDVLHKVEMDVTETGTVAAATTAIVLQRGGDIKNFLANRPFLFFIRHEHSKLILFWGTVNKPTPSY